MRDIPVRRAGSDDLSIGTIVWYNYQTRGWLEMEVRDSNLQNVFIEIPGASDKDHEVEVDAQVDAHTWVKHQVHPLADALDRRCEACRSEYCKRVL